MTTSPTPNWSASSTLAWCSTPEGQQPLVCGRSLPWRPAAQGLGTLLLTATLRPRALVHKADSQSCRIAGFQARRAARLARLAGPETCDTGPIRNRQKPALRWHWRSWRMGILFATAEYPFSHLLVSLLPHSQAEPILLNIRTQFQSRARGKTGRTPEPE